VCNVWSFEEQLIQWTYKEQGRQSAGNSQLTISQSTLS